MNTISLLELSSYNDGNPLILKNGALALFKNTPEYQGFRVELDSTNGTINATSIQIINKINEGYLPYVLSLNDGKVGLFKYYGYDIDNQPFVIFDYSLTQADQARGLILGNNFGIDLPEWDFLYNLTGMIIDSDGNFAVYQPVGTVPQKGGSEEK